MRPTFRMLRGFLLAAGLALAGLGAVAAPASAFVCGARADLVRYLDEVFREKPAAYGVTGNGEQLAELFVSATGSWTLIVTAPRGPSCVLASGDSWETIPALKLEPEA